jgi:hypothetical protein
MLDMPKQINSIQDYKKLETNTHITQEQQNPTFTLLAGRETVQFGLNAAQSLDEVCCVRFAVQYSKAIGYYIGCLRNGGSPVMVSK